MITGFFFDISQNQVNETLGHTSNMFSDLMPLLLIIFAIPFAVGILKFIIELVIDQVRFYLRKSYLQRLETKFIEYIEKGGIGIDLKKFELLSSERRKTYFMAWLKKYEHPVRKRRMIRLEKIGVELPY